MRGKRMDVARRVAGLVLLGACAVPAWAARPQAGGCGSGGAIVSLGQGTPGTAGTPRLVSEGAPLLGHPFALRVHQGRPGGVGALVLGPDAAPVLLPRFGATFHPAAPHAVLGFALDAAGTSAALLESVPVVPSLCGTVGVGQAGVLDPLAQGGIAFTRGLRVELGELRPGPQFDAPRYGVGKRAEDTAVADLDGDGKLDLVVAQQGEGGALLRGRGDGTFQAAELLTAGGAMDHVELGDVDGDGWLDAVLVSNRSSLTVLHGKGGGAFELPRVLPTANIGSLGDPFEMSDLDGDGRSDAVVASSLQSNVVVHLGGAEGLGPQTLVSTAQASADLGIGDLDGDLVPDLVVVHGITGTLSTLLGRGDGSFHPHVEHAVGSPSSFPGILDLGDVDGDGALDAVLKADGSVLLLRGTGAGGFGLPEPAVPVDDPLDLELADLDADGHLDLVTSELAGLVRSWRGLGDGGFVETQSFPHSDADVLELEDVSGDGALDLVATGSRTWDVTILQGTGAGTFVVPVDLVGSSTHAAIALGDVDGDGAADLVEASDPSGLVVWRGAGDGSFVPGTPVPTAAQPGSLLLVDLEPDGRLDAVVTGGVAGEVQVHRGLAGGSFAAGTSTSIGDVPGRPAAADLDGDGDLDLAVPVGPADEVVLLRQRPDGTFALVRRLASPERPSSIVAGDFDEDGTVDLLVGNLVSRDVVLVRGLGGFTYGTPVVVPFPPTNRLLLSTDLDGDGHLDLLAALSRTLVTNGLLVAHGRGDGTFEAAVVPAVPSFAEPSSADLVDVDGDRILDVLSASGDACALLLFRGLEDGSFLATRSFLVDRPIFAVAGDVDGDDQPDALVSTDWGVVLMRNHLLR